MPYVVSAAAMFGNQHDLSRADWQDVAVEQPTGRGYCGARAILTTSTPGPDRTGLAPILNAWLREDGFSGQRFGASGRFISTGKLAGNIHHPHPKYDRMR